MTVRNFNDREYYVEWANAGSTDRHRAAAFVAEVAGVSIAHVRELTADGSIPAKHFLLKAAITPDGQLSLRHLSGNFFETKDVSTSAKLRKVIEDEIANEALYGEDTFIGHRVEK
jgi:hypothetical protein